MNKKARSKNPLKPKTLFKWIFMDIITATPPKILTSETNLSTYIVDSYKKNTKLYGRERITTGEMMDKL